MTSLLKQMYRPGAFDSLFAFIGLISVYGIYYSLTDMDRVVVTPGDPLPKALALLGAVLLSTIIASLMNRFEQRMADDFTFQTLSKSSMIAIFGYIFALAGWEFLFRADFGSIPQRTTLAMLILTWSLAYFYTRFRGTRA